ncbi:hypothetical protein HZ326_13170 [Fusarium oxysporum f. sp. albedinis]|nr:hypothetical protein HZ326_13170 [Fusarium oxysporum f. sp. albedinis]
MRAQKCFAVAQNIKGKLEAFISGLDILIPESIYDSTRMNLGLDRKVKARPWSSLAMPCLNRSYFLSRGTRTYRPNQPDLTVGAMSFKRHPSDR